jgi:hypothetical protein
VTAVTFGTPLAAKTTVVQTVTSKLKHDQ